MYNDINKLFVFLKDDKDDNMLTTEQAAEILQVSRRRVQELGKNGALDAQKVSGIWMVSEESVERRLRASNKVGGRPSRGKARQETSFTLMNRTHEVTNLVYNASRKEFTYIDSELDTRFAPIGLTNSKGIMPLDGFNSWWRNRGIPNTRYGLATLLEEAGVALPEELLQRNLGLSLSDQYWIRPEGSGLKWEDVNFFNNDFKLVSVITGDYAADGKAAKAIPDNTSDGNLQKTWVCRGKRRFLLKGGTTYGQEPYNEVVATALHRRLLRNQEYVAYSLEQSGAAAQSCCQNFLTDEEEFVSAYYVEQHLAREKDLGEYEHYLACCKSLGVASAEEALNHMIVCDDIIANHDRHHRNFGLVRNVETQTCRPAPIFDSGSSLWCDLSTKQLAAGEHSFTSKQFHPNPAQQMLLVSSFDWMDSKSLEGFVDEALEILAQNDALGERLHFIQSALKWRIKRIVSIVEW